MLNAIFSDLWKNYRGRLLGSIFGLFIGVMFLILGFLQTIFLLICITAGFFLGNKLDKKEDLMEWLDRLLPPGYHDSQDCKGIGFTKFVSDRFCSGRL